MSCLPFNKLNNTVGILFTLMVSLWLTSCSDSLVWNNPHPSEEEGGNNLYSSFDQRPKHLDPARSYSSNEARFIDQIYDPPLQYHYLKRPYELIPNTLIDMPKLRFLDGDGNEVADDSNSIEFSEYTLSLKSNIRYQPHPAFAVNSDGEPLYQISSIADLAGRRTLADFEFSGSRELYAKDYQYQIKRLADPDRLSPIKGLMSEYIVGMKELSAQISAARQELEPDQWLDLDQFDLPGVIVVDQYTYKIVLNGLYPQFRYWLAYHFFAPMPREVDRFYHQPGFAKQNLSLDWYPVGTGPFMMTKNDPNEAIILEKNPNYRDDYYPDINELTATEVAQENPRLLESSGQKIPFIDKAIYRLEKEAIPLWTKFLQGYYDRSGISSDSFDQAIKVGAEGIGLSDEMVAKGINLDRVVVPGTYYLGFNMLDSVVGQQGDQEQQDKARKLRQAIAIAYDQAEMISIFYNGRGEVAMGPVPPGIFGYLPGKAGINPYVFDWDEASQTTQRKPLSEAKRLLAEAGYPNGRNAINGEPLILNLDTTGGASANQTWMIKQFAKLGIQLNIRSTDYNRFQEKMQTGNAQIFQWGWLADYPDAENFLFLLASANGQVANGGSGVNATNYQNPEYDRLFNQMKVMEDSPERLQIIRQMLSIIQRDTPWASSWHPMSYILNNAWVENSKPHGISKATLKYLKIDQQERARLRQLENQTVLWPLLMVLVVLLLFMLPGYLAYRRRQQRRIITALVVDH